MNGFVREHLERQVKDLRFALDTNGAVIDELENRLTQAHTTHARLELELVAFEAALEGTE